MVGVMSSFGPAWSTTTGPEVAGLIAMQSWMPALVTPETPEAGSAVMRAMTKQVLSETMLPQLIALTLEMRTWFPITRTASQRSGVLALSGSLSVPVPAMPSERRASHLWTGYGSRKIASLSAI